MPDYMPTDHSQNPPSQIIPSESNNESEVDMFRLPDQPFNEGAITTSNDFVQVKPRDSRIETLAAPK